MNKKRTEKLRGVKSLDKGTPVDSWLAHVEIKEAINGRAQIYINRHLHPGYGV